MKKKFLLAALSMVVLAGCNSDDDSNSSGLEGQWSVIKVGNGFIGPPNEYEEGQITWRFKSNSQIVVSKTDATFPGPGNGTYPYTIEPWEQMCEESLYIDENNYGCMELEGDTLRFIASAVDGPDYILVR